MAGTDRIRNLDQPNINAYLYNCFRDPLRSGNRRVQQQLVVNLHSIIRSRCVKCLFLYHNIYTNAIGNDTEILDTTSELVGDVPLPHVSLQVSVV